MKTFLTFCLTVSLLGAVPSGASPAKPHPTTKKKVVVQAISVTPAPAHPDLGTVPTYDKKPGLTRVSRSKNWSAKVPGLATPPGERPPADAAGR